jgi:hypothetical protein
MVKSDETGWGTSNVWGDLLVTLLHPQNESLDR